jgi:hypothetical protein
MRTILDDSGSQELDGWGVHAVLLLANPARLSAGMAEFFMQVAQRLRVVFYREFRRIDLIEEVHVRVRMHLTGALIHGVFPDSFDIQLGLEGGERLLVLGDLLAGCREPSFPIRCEFCGFVCLLGVRARGGWRRSRSSHDRNSPGRERGHTVVGVDLLWCGGVMLGFCLAGRVCDAGHRLPWGKLWLWLRLCLQLRRW